MSFAHIIVMSRSGFKTQWSESKNETRLWGFKTETRRDETRLQKISRYPPLLQSGAPEVQEVPDRLIVLETLFT